MKPTSVARAAGFANTNRQAMKVESANLTKLLLTSSPIRNPHASREKQAAFYRTRPRPSMCKPQRVTLNHCDCKWCRQNRPISLPKLDKQFYVIPGPNPKSRLLNLEQAGDFAPQGLADFSRRMNDADRTAAKFPLPQISNFRTLIRVSRARCEDATGVSERHSMFARLLRKDKVLLIHFG